MVHDGVTRRFRRELGRFLGRHDRCTFITTEYGSKYYEYVRRLRSELRHRKVTIPDMGGHYIRSRMMEPGFARRIFKEV